MSFWSGSRPIETMDHLLVAMSPGQWNASRGVLRIWRHSKNGEADVVIGFDHGYSDSWNTHEVPLALAREAVDKGYVAGKLEWGGRSSWEFMLTEIGRDAAREAHQREDRLRAERELAEREIKVVDDTAGEEG